jgi:hypothetical protein
VRQQQWQGNTQEGKGGQLQVLQVASHRSFSAMPLDQAIMQLSKMWRSTSQQRGDA